MTVLEDHQRDLGWAPPTWSLIVYWDQPTGSYVPCPVPNGGGCFDASTGSMRLSHDVTSLYHELTHLWAWTTYGDADPGHSRPEWALVAAYTPP